MARKARSADSLAKDKLFLDNGQMVDSSVTQLLNEQTAIPYLLGRGVIQDDAVVETLAGGVSNIVLAIHNDHSDLVLKQALPQLKTERLWFADQARAITEALGIEILHSITPHNVPELVDVDPIRFTLTMKRSPRSYLVWKSELLEGNISWQVGAELGKILATWHNFGFDNPEVQAKFPANDLFEQLRIWPFYRVIQDKYPDFHERIGLMISEIEDEKLTLVHGDFSPKNILVNNEDETIVLDFEVMHVGNPVFDLGFLIAHLVCKAIRADLRSDKNAFRDTAQAFLNAYEAQSRNPISVSLPNHIAIIALARVDGVSPVNYLTPAQQEELRSAMKAILSGESTELMELFP